jgi:hypothetical protein
VTRHAPDRRRVLTLVIPLAAGITYACIGVWWLRFVYLSDFFQMIWLADAQRALVPTAFANGFLGMGYPAVLNAVTMATGNILTSGKLVQAASGLAILAMLPRLFRETFDDEAGVVLAQVLLAIDAVFVFAAAGETPDLLAAAFMTGGVLAAATFVRRPATGTALAAGAILGIGYLVRYHSLLLLPWVVLGMIMLAAPGSRRTAWWAVAGFLLAAAPQFIVSGLVQGNPLYNLHIKSVAMGYYGTSADFVEKTRPYTLWRVLSENPTVVARQYAVFVARYFSELGGTALLLAAAVLAQRRQGRMWTLLAFPAIALTMLLAAKFYTDRAIVFQLVIWYVVVARALALVGSSGEPFLSRAAAVTLAASIAFASVLDAGRTWSRFARLRDRNIEITAVLRGAGLDNSRRVFTTHLSYYLADDPGGGAFFPHDTWLLYDPHYARAFPHAYLTDVPSLASFAEKHDIRFLLLGPLTVELSDEVFRAQQSGDLGPRFRLLRTWGDLRLFEYARAQRPEALPPAS